jgi:hypothetical protein
MPPAGLDNLKHIVVLMMENRSFDHMLGGLTRTIPKINGLTGNESNPDMNGTMVAVQPNAKFQGQLDHDPDHHFPGVDLQIFGGTPPGPGRVANMQGFIKSYATQGTNIKASHAIMSYFPPANVPVLTKLATEYAVFNGWFSSIPGPTICNRAFAHYGTSFGNVDMNLFYIQDPILSIYERMVQAGHTAKIYYYDQQSSTMEIVNLLKNQPQIFGSYSQFVADCKGNTLPEYCFIEPSTTIILVLAGARSLPPTNTPTTTSRKARDSSPTPTTPFAPINRFGKLLLSWWSTTSTAESTTTSFPRPVNRTVTVRLPTKPAPARRSTLTVSASVCRRFSSRPMFPEEP